MKAFFLSHDNEQLIQYTHLHVLLFLIQGEAEHIQSHHAGIVSLADKCEEEGLFRDNRVTDNL